MTDNNSEEPGNFREIFMPEGLCARCAETEVALEAKFHLKDPPDEVNLGFCGEECFVQFLLGVKAAKMLA